MQTMHLIPRPRVKPILDLEFFAEAERDGTHFRLPDMPELPENLRRYIKSGKEMTALFAEATALLAEAAEINDRLAQFPFAGPGGIIATMNAEANELLGLAIIIGLAEAEVL